LPFDNDHYGLLRSRAEQAGVSRIITFGENDGADIRLASYQSDGAVGEIGASIFGEPFEFILGAPGKHQAMNALSVIAAARALNLPAAKISQGLRSFGAGAGRGAQTKLRLSKGRGITLFDESYNANPTSMAVSIALLGQLTPSGDGRRIAVLGDMLELGPAGPALHAALAKDLVAAGVDKLYVAGALMTALWDAAPEAMRAARADNAAGLASEILESLRDGDIVMVKGSNGSKISEIATALKAAAKEK
jgi:UDP-N-acetylmuramoyl-tripeptide--D-alanyl-D-alanine ligase